MNPLQHVATCVCAVMMVCSTLSAATLQWSYTLGASSLPYQVVADGAGGCAVIFNTVAGYKLVWLDKSGTERYSVVLLTFPYIITCQKSALVFFYNNGLDFQVTTVDKKGTASDTAAANVDFYDYPALAMNLKSNQSADSKGYFLTKFDKGSSVAFLERYSYK